MLALACALGTLAAVPAASAAVGSVPAVRQVSGPVSWGQFLGDAGHTGTVATDIPPPLEVVWSFDDPVSTFGVSTPLVVHTAAATGDGVEGDVVVAVGRTRVYLLDAATGEVRTTVIRQDSRITEPAIAEVDGRPLLLYVQGEGDATSLVAVDLAAPTPAQVWTFPLGDDSLSGVTVAGADGDIALVGDRQGEVHAIALGEVAEGASRELWKREVGNNPGASIAADDAMAYVPVIDTEQGHSRVVALRLSDGRPQWTYEAPAAGTNFGTALTSTAVDEHQVAVGFPDRTVHSIDPRTGAERSTGIVRGLLLTTPTTIKSTPIVSDGDIYIEDIISGVSDFLPSALYRIDGDTGERVWDFQFDASPARSAPLVSGDVIYIGLGDGGVAAVDRASGELVWNGDTGDAPVLGLAASGDLILAATGGRNGGVIALRHTDGPLIREQSPTHVDTGTMLANLGLGFLVAVGGLFLLFGVLLRRFGPRKYRDGETPTGEADAAGPAHPAGEQGGSATEDDAVDEEGFEQVDGDDGESLEDDGPSEQDDADGDSLAVVDGDDGDFEQISDQDEPTDPRGGGR